jgi:beta-glucanase (GH16 family)
MSPAVSKPVAIEPLESRLLASVSAAPAAVALSELAPTPSVSPPRGRTWSIALDDEFSSTALAAPWQTHQYWSRTSTSGGQGELETYTPDGVSASDGILHLSARPSTAQEQAAYGTAYVSGLIETGGIRGDRRSPRFSFLHGYLEARAQLPAGQGLWPAIWMMPASYKDDNGELDVMENLGGQPATEFMTLHRHGKSRQFTYEHLSGGFHIFGVDWEANFVKWYLDGALVATCTDKSLICPTAMYPILNLAVGGTLGGPPTEGTAFPASFGVDYVRIWRTIKARPRAAGMR